MAPGHPNFEPAVWLDQWLRVGGLLVNVAGACLTLNLDGNQTEQQSLLSKLDSKRGRRALVRDEALRRLAR